MCNPTIKDLEIIDSITLYRNLHHLCNKYFKNDIIILL